MKVYAFDLLPWPHLDEPSYDPDPSVLFDPARGREVYAEHLDQMAMYEEYGFDAICMNEHHSKPYGHPVRLAEEIAMLDCMSRAVREDRPARAQARLRVGPRRTRIGMPIQHKERIRWVDA